MGGEQKSIYYGSKKIDKIYKGNTLVYQSHPPLPPVRFDPSDSIQEYNVPQGYTKFQIDCVGSSSGEDDLTRGTGGRVQCILTIDTRKLYIVVGKPPKDNWNIATYNASDIRTEGSGITNNSSLKSRIIVAGGGGSCAGASGWGGEGGGLEAGPIKGTAFDYKGNGLGGTQSSGGSEGTVENNYTVMIGAGKAGTFGLGGNGTDKTVTYRHPLTEITVTEGPGGAGGAGWYGGGGGSLVRDPSRGYYSAGTGGGGSSYANPLYCTDVVHTKDYNNSRTGGGYIIITPLS